MASGLTPPTFLERARKFIVAGITLVVTVGLPYFDILSTSDFTSTEGIVKAAIAVAGALGVYQVTNAG